MLAMDGSPIGASVGHGSYAAIPELPLGSSCFAGIALPPVTGYGIAGAGKPFLVAAELFQCFRGKELRAVAGWMVEWFEQTRCNQPWNFVRLKAEKPRRLSCIEPCGNELPTEKFRLLGSDIHTAVQVAAQV